jgi:hypothetical protein
MVRTGIYTIPRDWAGGQQPLVIGQTEARPACATLQSLKVNVIQHICITTFHADWCCVLSGLNFEIATRTFFSILGAAWFNGVTVHGHLDRKKELSSNFAADNGTGELGRAEIGNVLGAPATERIPLKGTPIFLPNLLYFSTSPTPVTVHRLSKYHQFGQPIKSQPGTKPCLYENQSTDATRMRLEGFITTSQRDSL